MTDLATLGLEADSRSIKTATQDLDRLSESAHQAEDAADDLAGGSDRAGSSLRNRLQRESDRATNSLRGLLGVVRNVAIGLGAAFGVRELINLTGTWTDLNARVRIAVGSQEDATQTMERLERMARRTYSSLNTTAESFLLNSTVLKELGYNTQQQLDFTESLNNAMVVSGARGQRAETVMNALSRAMAGGSLQGNDLNVIMQTGGRVTQALAESLGVTTGELRRMSHEGKLTNDVLFRAMIENLQTLREEADSMPATIGDAFIILGNSILGFIGRMDDATEVTQDLAAAIIEFADWMTGFGRRVLPYVGMAIQFVRDHLQDLYDLFVVFVSLKIVLYLGSVAGAFITMARAIRTTGLVMFVINNIIRGKITLLLLLAAVVAKVTGTFDTLVGWVRELGTTLMNALPEDIRARLQETGESLSELLVGINDTDTAGAESLETYFNALDRVDASVQDTTASSREMAEALESVNELVDRGLGPFEQLQREIDALGAALNKGAIDWEVYADAVQRARANAASSALGLAADVAGSLSQIFDKSKALAIAEVILSTGAAIMKTFAQYGYTPWGIAAASAAGLQGVAQLVALRRTTKEGNGGIAGVQGGGSVGGAPTAPAQSGPATLIQLVGDGMYSQSQIRRLMEQLIKAQGDGSKLVLARN